MSWTLPFPTLKSSETLFSNMPEYFLNFDGIFVQVIAACIVFALAVCSFLFFESRKAGLSHIPGPFLARYSDLWALYFALKIARAREDKEDRRTSSYQDNLRTRYGDVVRVGPRTVSVFDAAAVPIIYSVRARLDKVGTRSALKVSSDSQTLPG